jgi:hypothetical protein
LNNTAYQHVVSPWATILVGAAEQKKNHMHISQHSSAIINTVLIVTVTLEITRCVADSSHKTKASMCVRVVH